MRPGRHLVLVVVGYMLTVLQASLQALVPVRVRVPELGLLVALYAGLTARGGVAGASAVAFALGYVTDLLAGAPKGLHALVFVLMCLLAKGASLRLLLRGSLVSAGFAFAASLSAAGLIVLTRAQTESGTLAPLQMAPLQAAVTALAAPIVYGLLGRLEGRVAKAHAPGLGR
ncbi:MAG TPA: rod shape-determining protein MreD [Polyangia bacterium]|nr:rod shape-determining protein MreD [Polyangia bacterium]